MSDAIATPTAPAATPSTPAPAPATPAPSADVIPVRPSPGANRAPARPDNPLAATIAKKRETVAPAPTKDKADPATVIPSEGKTVQEPDATAPAPATPPAEKPAETGSLRDRLRAKQPVEAPPAPTPDATAQPDFGVPDAELKALPDDPDRFRRRIVAFERKVEHERLERERVAQEAAELKRQLEEVKTKTPELPADYQQSVEELKRLRRLKDITKDPDYQAFDKRIKLNESMIADALKSVEVPAWINDEITKAGGLLNFSRSKAEFAVRDDGSGKTKITAAELYNRLVANMAPADQDAIRGAAAEIAKAKREQETWAAEEAKNAGEYYANLEKQEQARKSAQENFLKTVAAESPKIVDHLVAANKWLADVSETDPNAKTENAFRADLRAVVKETVTSPVFISALQSVLTDPEVMALAEKNPKLAETKRNESIKWLGDIVTDSVRSYSLTREVQSLQARAKQLEADLLKARGASSTTSAPGSGTTAPSSVASSGNVPSPEVGESKLAYSTRLRRSGISDAQIASASVQYRDQLS